MYEPQQDDDVRYDALCDAIEALYKLREAGWHIYPTTAMIATMEWILDWRISANDAEKIKRVVGAHHEA